MDFSRWSYPNGRSRRVGEGCGFRFWFLAVFVSITTGQAWAQTDPALLGRIKSAVAFVSGDQGSGTAFCVSGTGRFVTCAHVVDGLVEGESIKLVMNPATPSSTVIEASLEAIDVGRDLALLRCLNPPASLGVLTLGDDTKLNETEAVLSAGYPFGKVLGRGDYPAVSVNTGRVTSLKREGERLGAIQFDAPANPGDSGGPLMNGQGAVIGVINSGILGSGVNYAIPVSELRQFFKTPVIDFDFPEFEFSERYQARDFEFEVKLLAPSRNIGVRFFLEGPVSGKREFEVRPKGDDRYVARAAPLVEGKDTGVGLVGAEVTVRSEDGSLSLTKSLKMVDKAIRVSGSDVRLSRISQINQGSVIYTRADGSGGNGRLSPPAEAVVNDGRGWKLLDLTKVDRGVLVPELPSTEPVVYSIEVYSGRSLIGRKVGLLENQMELAGVAEAGAADHPVGLKPLSVPAGREEIALEGKIEQVVKGGHGRYLICKLKSPEKVVVVDVIQRQRVGELAIRAGMGKGMLIAANSTSMLAASPADASMYRYEIPSLTKVAETPIALGPGVRSIGAGSSTTGFFLLAHRREGAHVERFYVANAQDFRIVSEIGYEQSRPFGKAKSEFKISASDDGSRYVLNLKSDGSVVVDVGDGKIKHYELSLNSRLATVGPGGSYLFGQPHHSLAGASGGVIGPDFSSVRTFGTPPYLGVSFVTRTSSPRIHAGVWLPPGGEYADEKSRAGHLDLIEADTCVGHRVPSGPFPELWCDLSDPQGIEDFSERIHVYPELDLLVVLNREQTGVVFYPLHREEVIGGSRDGGFVIGSVPSGHVRPGEKFEYQVELWGGSGQTTYQLLQNPEGMAVSKGGLITWSVPENFGARGASDVTGVLLLVKSGDGIERFDSFDLRAR